MDWRNYQFWRKDICRVDETTAEFDLLVQRTKQRITIGKQLRKSIRLLQRTPTSSKSISRRTTIVGKFCDLRKNFVKIERFDKKKLILKKFKFKPNDLLITEMYNFLKLSAKNNTSPLSVNKIKYVSKIALAMQKSIKEKKLIKL